MLLQPLGLVVWVVGLLPLLELVAVDVLVRLLPGELALGAGDGATVGAHLTLVLQVGDEARGALMGQGMHTYSR